MRTPSSRLPFYSQTGDQMHRQPAPPPPAPDDGTARKIKLLGSLAAVLDGRFEGLTTEIQTPRGLVPRLVLICPPLHHRKIVIGLNQYWAIGHSEPFGGFREIHHVADRIIKDYRAAWVEVERRRAREDAERDAGAILTGVAAVFNTENRNGRPTERRSPWS